MMNAPSVPKNKPQSSVFDLFSACHPRDLLTLRLALPRIYSLIRPRHIWVACRSRWTLFSRLILGRSVSILNEDTMIPDMTLAALRQLPVEPFPKGAGWYYQQLIKYSFSFHQPEVPYYLVWDADTIPLRSLSFFSSDGKSLLADSDESHLPYRNSYKRLFREEPPAGLKSFISQHMMMKKSIVQEMLTKIDANFPGRDSWAWKLMRTLPSKGVNLFSEYETYGWYASLHYPGQISRIDRPWLRDGISYFGYPPTTGKLARLSASFDYTSFEVNRASWPSLFCVKKAIA